MKALGVLLLLTGALALQTTISGLTMGGARMVNLVVVAVVYAALMFGPVTGLFAGTIGGLAQDALAGGVVGIGSLAKTIIGFISGLLGAHFIVAQPLPRFVMFVGASVVHELCFQGLYALIEVRGVQPAISRRADAGGHQRDSRADGLRHCRARAGSAAAPAGQAGAVLARLRQGSGETGSRGAVCRFRQFWQFEGTGSLRRPRPGLTIDF